MKFLLKTVFFLNILILLSCGQNASNEGTTDSQTATDTSSVTRSATPQRDTHSCTVSGEMLENNQFWAREQEVLVAIVADSTTYSKDLDAPGHRILAVYDTKNCSQILRQALPVDESPDFPYYIADITYNNVTQLVGIRGTTFFYLYDVAQRKLLPKLKPSFATKRPGIDAQSGMIQRLEIWENFLVGYAQDFGAFVYDVRNQQNPAAVMPFGEYKIQDGDYGSLFLLPAGAGNGKQGIVPSYDRETGDFKVNPVFDQPIDVNTAQVNKSALNNRYIVMRDANNNPIAVDLRTHARAELPADVVTKPTQQILDFLKKKR